MATRFGNYILLRKLAAGGMAEVFLAKQTGLAGFERLVCVKKILPHLAEHGEFIAMFQDEAKIAAQLTHPNIAQIYELGEIDGTYFIAMELVRGDDVRHIYNAEVARGRSMPFVAAAQILHGACCGLAFAHRKTDMQGAPMNIVHRDVSPQNLLVTYDGFVKVVDFGVAKARGKMTETRSGVLKGKYSYMSPEQARGQSIDARSDIFSAGIILYEITTGTRLFKRENELETLHAVMDAVIPLPSTIIPDYPVGLERAVMKALSIDANQRYDTADDFARDLEAYLVTAGATTSPAALDAYMHELFAQRIATELAAGEAAEDGATGAESDVARPSTRSSRASNSARRNKPRADWADRSSASNPSRVSGGSNSARDENSRGGNRRPLPAELESAPTAGLDVDTENELSATMAPGGLMLPAKNTGSGARPATDLQPPLSGFLARHRFTVWLGLTAILVIGVGISAVMILQSGSGDSLPGSLPPRPASRTGPILISTLPRGAKIVFPALVTDDPAVLEAQRSRTEFTLKEGLPKGRPIRFRVELPGYKPIEGNVDPDDEKDLTSKLSALTLERDSTQIVLTPVTIETQPSGAGVFLDGQFTGQKTPLEGFKVEAGSQHTFEFVLDGFHPKKLTQFIPLPQETREPIHLSELLTPVGAAPVAVPDPMAPAAPTHQPSVARPNGRDRPVEDGYLSIDSPQVPYQVSSDRRQFGLTPLKKVALKPGTYHLTLSNKQLQLDQDVTAVVRSGATESIVVQHGEGSLAVNATPYAMIRVADKLEQETPTVFSKLLTGEYTVRATCPNKTTQVKKVVVVKGKAAQVAFTCAK